MSQAARGMSASVLFNYTDTRDRVPKFLKKYENERYNSYIKELDGRE